MPYEPPDDPSRPDILLRLRRYADEAEVTPADELANILREAAEVIVTLRQLIGIKEEIWLEDIEPEGNA